MNKKVGIICAVAIVILALGFILAQLVLASGNRVYLPIIIKGYDPALVPAPTAMATPTTTMTATAVPTPTATPTAPTDDLICLPCHRDGGIAPAVSVHSNRDYANRTQEPFRIGCTTCHTESHAISSSNIYRVRTEINGHSVVFTQTVGIDSFDEDSGDGSNLDDICATCHTTTAHNNRAMTGRHNEGADCTICHLHEYDGTSETDDGFMPPATGPAGGPDCVACHDLGGIAPSHVDVSALEDSVHANLGNRSDAPNSACWTCHGNGSRPSSHPADYKNPKVCTDCHENQVYEHYRSGRDIQAVTDVASDLLSCLTCHQEVRGMVQRNSDPDSGSFDADGDRTRGGSTSAYHYGRARRDLVRRGTVECDYCHQHAGEFASVFEDSRNMYIDDHVADEPGESPQCSDCHGEGHLHDANLEKPEPTIAFCKGCHQHEDHNRGRDCLSCHIDVHGVEEEPEGPDWLHALSR